MATGSQDPSRRSKHRRSSIDDSGESSKRRKHRHKHDTDVADERESVPFRHVASSRVDSDVEEGEIIEEGDDPTMEIHNAHAEVGDRSSLSKENNVNDSEDNLVKNGKVLVGEDMTDGSRTCNESVSLHKSSYGISSNGDIGLVILKENYSVSRESESPVKSRRERSNNDKSFDSKTHSKSLSTRDEDRDTHGRYHEDVQSTRRSHSMERGRERSKSLSISEKVSSMKMTHEKDGPRSKDAKKTNNSLEDERMAVDNWDSRHGYRDGMRDNDRERSSSYIRHRYMDSHQSRESRDGDREKSRKKDQYGRDMGSSQKREKMEDHDGESRKETSSRDRERQTERKRYRESERERGKKSDREREERELERERDRRKDRELERVRDSGRNRSRDRESYGDRESRRNRSIDRESKRNRSRDRERDIDDDRFSKNRNYQKKDPDGYEDRRMYKDSRSSRDDGTDYKNSGDKDNENRSRRYEEEQEEYQERVELQLVDQEEDDVDRIKEESRRRTLAIIEKFKMQLQQNLHNPQLENEDKEHVGQASHQVVATSVALETLAVSNEEETGTVVGDPSFIVSKFPPQNGVSASEKTSGEGGLGFGTPKSETSGDMFCDDIFGDSPAGIRKTGKGDGLAIQRDGLHDNWDDAEGYYSFRLGEILDGRYEVAAAHGKGVFSTVVRAKDLKAGLGDPEEVAIKIIRNNEHMHKAGKEELVILKKLVGADPEDRRHCVRFLSSFKYRNHLCLVFESLSMNLREVLKKFGRNIGLRLTAVRTYSKQLFIALKHLRNCGVLHSDIKPDNMLVNEAKNVLKLCDFGNAMFAGKNEITPYLVSRFYRAPEIILGMPYDHPLDMWSVGCCIFELYSGKVLFPGATNNDMLRLHMELKGLFPKKMLRKGAFTEQHFDQDLNFLAIEEDPVTKKTMRRLITSIKPKDISAIVTSSPGADPKMLANFKDLLEKIFILDPDKRLTVSQALSHPFITGK